MKRLYLIFLTALILFTLSACGKSETHKLVIADQFGLAYAPVEILKSTDILKDALIAEGVGDTEVVWQRMGNTAAIREAMVAGDLDVGFVAIPPFLIGRDNGMDWRIISGVSVSPVGLVASTAYETLDDIDEDARIILPQLGSVQHILLSMYAERVCGDSHYFDDQIVSMSHPDGMMALLGDETDYLHFTTPPFLEQELMDDRYHTILRGDEAFGETFTFIVSVCPERVYEDEAVYRAFKKALLSAISYMTDNPDEAFAILHEAYDYDDELLRAVLDDPQMAFQEDIEGMATFQDYMKNAGMLHSLESFESLIWDH